ncbi:MAG TPA: response regulator transcription factor [Chloroflexota bacterium]|nr:response regulator transcription factor [Chloroflexota bacterium]
MLPAPLILVAEDDSYVRDFLVTLLESEGYRVDSVASGPAALARGQAGDVDLIVLDRGLPGLDGLTVCERLATQPGRQPAIIMVTAFTHADQRLEGFAAGVDDYVTKPFSPGELVARIESVLRRTARASAGPAPLRIDERLQIDFPEHQVLVDGQPIDLKPTEASLLRVLVERADQVVPLEAILTEVWGPAYVDSPHYVHLYVNYLRRKIEPDPRAPRYILTQRGIGYRFAMPVPASSRRRAARAEGAATR